MIEKGVKEGMEAVEEFLRELGEKGSEKGVEKDDVVMGEGDGEKEEEEEFPSLSSSFPFSLTPKEIKTFRKSTTPSLSFPLLSLLRSSQHILNLSPDSSSLFPSLFPAPSTPPLHPPPSTPPLSLPPSSSPPPTPDLEITLSILADASLSIYGIIERTSLPESRLVLRKITKFGLLWLRRVVEEGGGEWSNEKSLKREKLCFYSLCCGFLSGLLGEKVGETLGYFQRFVFIILIFLL